MPMFARVSNPRAYQKTVVLPLCERFLLQSDRTASYSYTPMPLEEAEEYGPYLESMYAMVVGKNRTANFDWKVVCTWSNDGQNFNTPFTDISAAITVDGQSNTTAITSGFQGPTAPMATVDLPIDAFAASAVSFLHFHKLLALELGDWSRPDILLWLTDLEVVS